MVLAVLVKDIKTNVSQRALDGLKKFRLASHTQNYKPARIEISPVERAKLPPKFKINNVPVVANAKLEPGTLRVCTADIPGIED